MILDGAIGTELIARGLSPVEECAEAWNRTRPEEVRAVAAAYFAAGADAVQTNTFGGNRFRLARFGLADQVRSLNLAACLLAREARPQGRKVIGSMGPCEHPDQDAFAEQAAALAEGGVDFLHLETCYDPAEARAALRGARAGAPGLSIAASMTCRLTPAGYLTLRGATAEEMLAVFLEEGAAAVGANCTLGAADMAGLIALLRARTQLPIFAKPISAGADAAALFAAGASSVGGCCGTTPAGIRALASV